MSNLFQKRGNAIYLLIREYMKKIISINNLIIVLLIQGLLQKHNITLLNHPYDKFYYENYVLEELEYYIKEVKYNNNIARDISRSILPKFVEDDDKRLKKLFRKILIIKKRNQQKQLMYNFYKWFRNINISDDNNKKSRNIGNKENKISKNIEKSNSLLVINNYNAKSNNTKTTINKSPNLKLSNNKKAMSKTCSFLTKNNKNKTNKTSKTNSLISNKTSPKIINNSKISSSFHFDANRNQNNKQKIKTKLNKNNKSCSISKQNPISFSETTTKNKKIKTPNKHKDMVQNFMNNLIINKKNKEEKMKKLNDKHEEKINSIYTFTPKLIQNKKNEKYLKNMVDKLVINNNIRECSKNNISNDDNKNNSENRLNIVIEENRKNKDINFISRLSEYEKRRINNLEKIKNDILIEEYLNSDMSKFNYFNDKYNISDDHLLNVSNSYYHNKKKLIDKLIKDIDEEKGITFEPKLNKEYNNKIKSNFTNLKEVLTNKKNEKKYDYLSYKDKECTFQPRINYLDEMNLSNNRSNVGERLLAYQDKYNQKLIELKNKSPRYSFKPKISKNTYIILKKKRFINSLKGGIKANFSATNNNRKFEEEKYSLKIKEKKKLLENKGGNLTPMFDYSKKENFNNINLNEFNLDEHIDYSDLENKINFYRNIKNSLRDNNNENKASNNIKNNNLMNFDYYDNLI